MDLTTMMQVLNMLPDGVLVVDENSILQEVNEQACKLFGYENGELTGKPLNMLLPRRYHEHHNQYVKEYFKDSTVRRMGHRGAPLLGLKQNGTEFDVNIALSPVTVEGEKKAVAIVRDITDLKDLERKLIWRNEQLQEINTGLEKFGYTVTHDLKSPLANIQAILYLILRELPKEQGEALQQYVNGLHESLRSMSDLISGIAAYSKPSVTEKTEEIDLREVMEELKKLIYLPENISLKVCEDLPLIRGNRTKLLQIFMNLITNAIKYNDKEKAEISISCEDNGKDYIIRIEDNGPGIPDTIRKSVFNLFEKGDSTRQDSQGIGLAIVKKNILESGGEVKIMDSPLGGAMFEISMPKLD